jgi:hypothetical protein
LAITRENEQRDLLFQFCSQATLQVKGRKLSRVVCCYLSTLTCEGGTVSGCQPPNYCDGKTFSPFHAAKGGEIGRFWGIADIGQCWGRMPR